MTLLVLLQNAYGVEEGYIPSFDIESFRNCHTGRRLRRAIPEHINIEIRNASPQVGDIADSYFPPNEEYVNDCIKEIDPEIILVCGSSAKNSIKNLDIDVPVLYMPHPAYRALTNKTLDDMYNTIDKFMEDK